VTDHERTRILGDGRQRLLREPSSASDRIKVVVEGCEVSKLSFGDIEEGRLNVQFGEMLCLSDEAADADVSVQRWGIDGRDAPINLSATVCLPQLLPPQRLDERVDLLLRR
jgi:hypothetical protein